LVLVLAVVAGVNGYENNMRDNYRALMMDADQVFDRLVVFTRYNES